MVYELNTSKGFDIGRTIFLEGQLERENVIKFNTGDTADETFRHSLVLADVHVLNVVELGVSRCFDIESEFLRLVVVNLN